MVGITTDMLVCYVTAVEARSWRKAAERLFLQRSSVSEVISRLEKRLGVNLYLRSKSGRRRTTRLTDAGKQFYDYAKATLAGLERFMENNQGKKVTR